MGAGCAWASMAVPTPARPKPAAMAKVVAAKRGRVFTTLTSTHRSWERNSRRARFLLTVSCQLAWVFPHVEQLQVWQVGHQNTLRPSSTAVRMAVAHTRHGSAARRYT